MPEISFVLPHWLYWSGLILFPLMAMVLFRKAALKQSIEPLSLSLGYFLLVVGGIFGVHRLYLKCSWALAFIVLFPSLLVVNVEVRSMRDDLSAEQNGVKLEEFRVQRGQKAVEKGRRNAEQRLSDARQKLTGARLSLEEAQQGSENWSGIAQILGGDMLLLLLIDLVWMPKLIRQRNQIEKLEPDEGFHCPVVEEEHEDRFEPLLFNRVISHINGVAGEFVAYWSVIAVFVYYYEVIARYVFNSPTNWAHESMFLMFGMQYLIAGGFVLREGAHVRVDVIYNYFSNRAKAVVDVLTSIFFFIFMLTLLVTGWTFFYDSYEVSEVSISEWGIQYWPIKLALSLGALLLLIQGIAQLIKDILVVIKPDAVSLDAKVRPEG